MRDSSERNELRNTGMCLIAHGTTPPQQWPLGNSVFRWGRPLHPSRGIPPNVAKVNDRAGPDYQKPGLVGKTRSSELHTL